MMMLLVYYYYVGKVRLTLCWLGTAVAAPPPFMPGKLALCGSRPPVTLYYCRLGDLLCFVFMSAYCMCKDEGYCFLYMQDTEISSFPFLRDIISFPITSSVLSND